jgi:hypothetical protein
MYKYSDPEADHFAWSADCDKAEAWDDAMQEKAAEKTQDCMADLYENEETYIGKEYLMSDLLDYYDADFVTTYIYERFKFTATTEEERAEEYTKFRTACMDVIEKGLYEDFYKGRFSHYTEDSLRD